MSRISHQAPLLCPATATPATRKYTGQQLHLSAGAESSMPNAAERPDVWADAHGPRPRELWPQSTAAAAHTRLWSKGTLLEGMACPPATTCLCKNPTYLQMQPPHRLPEHRHTSTFLHWTVHTDLGTRRENINWWPLFASHLANAVTVSVLCFPLHQVLIQYQHHSNWPSPQQGLELCPVVWGWPITLVMGRDPKSPTEHYLFSICSIPPPYLTMKEELQELHTTVLTA